MRILTTRSPLHSATTRAAWNINAGTVVLANTSGFGRDRGVTINGGTLGVAVVPEPGTGATLRGGLGILLAFRRRRNGSMGRECGERDSPLSIR